MNGTAMETLLQRMDSLERENLRLRRTGFVVLAVIVALGLMGHATGSKVAKVVEAERFVVRDASGTVRASLGEEADGVSMIFTDKGGNLRVRLEENRLAFFVDGKKEAVATLEAWPESSRLRLRQKDMRTSIFMGATENGPVAGLFNEPVPLDPGSAFPLAMFTVNLGTGSPELTFYNTKGKVIWKAP